MRPGELLGGRYRLSEPLGRGGMSVVWRARDERLGRAVAVKALASARAASADALARVRAEAMAAAKLRHPNIVDVHDYGEVPMAGGPRYPYVVMELVEGDSLAALLCDGPLAWPVAVPVCADVAAALAAAHERGIVHRDVTPGNVMLTRDGAKLVDFGISAAIGDAETTADGSLLGTPAYLAPERLDRGTARPATDVYALGLLLYKTLTGHLPWRSTTTAQMLAAHRYVDPAPLPPIAGLPPAVATACHSCLAKRPEDRPTSAELARELAAYAPVGWRTAARRRWPVGPGATFTMPSGWIRPAPATFGRAGVPHPSTAVMPHGTPLSTQRRRAARLTAVSLALLAATGGAVIGADPPGRRGEPAGIAAAPRSQPARCQVGYQLRRQGRAGFTAAMTVTNGGPTAVNPWRLDFAVPAGQRVTSATPGRWRQAGEHVSVYGGSLLPGGTVTLVVAGAVALTGADSTAGSAPSRFWLNGDSCATVPREPVAGRSSIADSDPPAVDGQRSTLDKDRSAGRGEAPVPKARDRHGGEGDREHGGKHGGEGDREHGGKHGGTWDEPAPRRQPAAGTGARDRAG